MTQYVDGMRESRPPSRTMTFPLQYAPALLVKNKIQPAMSSSVPDLSSGILYLGNIPSPMIPAARSLGNTVKVSNVKSCMEIKRDLGALQRHPEGDRGGQEWPMVLGEGAGSTYAPERWRLNGFHMEPN
jgi:hypothetical protein